MAEKKKTAARGKAPQRKKKVRRSFTDALAFITSSSNNTIVTVTDRQGNVLTWSAAGALGYRGAKKSTPYAASQVAESAGQKAFEQGIRNVDVRVRGVGPGREGAMRGLVNAKLNILSIEDVTPIPHNGCRPPKRRRG